MADQSNSASAANSNSPARPCEKPTVSLQSFPFLFHIPIILIIPILPILIPEETKKTFVTACQAKTAGMHQLKFAGMYTRRKGKSFNMTNKL